ncbi:hypothetical protein ACROYT_G025390 [Oculina patagonica]
MYTKVLSLAELVQSTEERPSRDSAKLLETMCTFFPNLMTVEKVWCVQQQECSATNPSGSCYRFKHQHVPFGIVVSQDIRLQKLDDIYKNIPNVTGIADAIIVFGLTEEEHDHGVGNRPSTTVCAKIAEKRKIVKKLKQQKLPQDHYIGHNPGNLTTRELSKLELDGAVGQQTPLDGLLKSMDPVQDQRMDGATWQSQPPLNRALQGFQGIQAWQTIPQPWQAPQTNKEMFLKPGRMEKGEKPLLIVDFVNNIVPQDEEETLGNQGNAEIVVTYGPKKPKLESITLQQWVVGNTHFQNYLAYTVKIMELSSKYEWRSVLLYDNEFHKLQAIYSFHGVLTPHTTGPLHTHGHQPSVIRRALISSRWGILCISIRGSTRTY